jgi:hypothetical protein
MEAMLPKPGQPTIGSARQVMSSGVCKEAVRRNPTLTSASAEIKEACVNGSKGRLVRCNIAGRRIVFATLAAFVASALVKPDETAAAPDFWTAG